MLLIVERSHMAHAIVLGAAEADSAGRFQGRSNTFL
jgi:hypothetical protein